MWGRTLVYFCAVILAASETEIQDSRLVDTAQGPVRGYKDSEHGHYAFKSIPYATAPTGPHKFKAPLPPPVWTQPLEAVDKRIICPQASFSIIPEDRIMQEDCLVANVYVPDTEDINLPVVFYVHGGAFQMGYGDWFVPKELITEHNIIYVTFNYRLGVHGFLSLGTKDAPGNAGMKDQLSALRWVKKNIASFGGNPDDITLHGSSAGSASVDLLMLSKSAEGLFNKVIAESGGSTAQWAIQSDPLQNAKWFAKTLNFTNVDDIAALEEFYKTASFDLLTSNSFSDRTDSTFVFSPCIERSTGEEVFLDKSPVDILKSGSYRKVPILYGYSNMEGLLRIDFFDAWKQKMSKHFSEFLPADLQFESKQQRENVAHQIKELYFGNKQVGANSILDYVDFFGDVIFAYPMLRAVKYHVEAGHDQIYLYEYSYVDLNTPFVPHTNAKGANHCAQTTAVFNFAPGFPNYTKSGEFSEHAEMMRKIWSNFIKTGKPVGSDSSLPAWPPVGENRSPHMSIATQLHLKGPLLERRIRLWDKIYSQHYRNPVPAGASPPRHNEL